MSSSEQEQTLNTQQKIEPTVLPKQTKQTQPSTVQSKKTASYTYWVDEKNKSRELPPEQRPQKINPSNVSNQNIDGGRSHWNTAGTWEHRKINLTEVETQYTQKINEWLSQACPQAKIKKVSLSGEFEVVFTRNKKALTYQITGSVQFQKTLPQSKEEEVQTENQKQETGQRKDNESDSLSLSDDKSEGSESPKQAKKKKTSKANNITFEITDLTDSGDRDHNVKADTVQDKKWIFGHSSKLLTILEVILNGYK